MAQPIHATPLPKFRSIWLTTTALMLSACTNSPPPATPVSDGPALWSVSDDDTTLYLFGYAPALPPETDWKTPPINAALSASDLFIFESDTLSPQAQQSIQALIPAIGLNGSGPLLSAQLTDDQAKLVNSVSEPLGAPLSALDPLQPWLASVQLGVLNVSQQGLDLQNTPQNQLVSLANGTDHAVDYLEEATHLMTILADLPPDEQVELLLHTARGLRDKPDDTIMIGKAWLTGDVKTVATLLHGENGAWSSERVYSALLIERNRQWVGTIDQLMTDHEGTIFLAAGLGHFAGKDSLITMLDDEGYSPRRL